MLASDLGGELMESLEVCTMSRRNGCSTILLNAGYCVSERLARSVENCLHSFRNQDKPPHVQGKGLDVQPPDRILDSKPFPGTPHFPSHNSSLYSTTQPTVQPLPQDLEYV